MKKLLFLFLLSSAALADEAIIATTINEDGSTNAWTATDLTDALGLINRRYHRDMLTPEGRRQWHGKIVKSEINPHTLERTDTYEDGYTHVTPPHTPVKPPAPAPDPELTDRRKAIIDSRDFPLPVSR